MSARASVGAAAVPVPSRQPLNRSARCRGNSSPHRGVAAPQSKPLNRNPESRVRRHLVWLRARRSVREVSEYCPTGRNFFCWDRKERRALQSFNLKRSCSLSPGLTSVELARKPAISLLDLFSLRVALDTEYFV